MFDINRYRRNDGKISRSDIAIDIASRRLRKNDIYEMIMCHEVKDAFQTNESFTPEKDRQKWDRDYLNDLKLKAAAEIFNQKYLFHLEEVAAYVIKGKPIVVRIFSIIPLLGIGCIAACAMAAGAVFFALGGGDSNIIDSVPSAVTHDNNVAHSVALSHDVTKTAQPDVSIDAAVNSSGSTPTSMTTVSAEGVSGDRAAQGIYSTDNYTTDYTLTDTDACDTSSNASENSIISEDRSNVEELSSAHDDSTNNDDLAVGEDMQNENTVDQHISEDNVPVQRHQMLI